MTRQPGRETFDLDRATETLVRDINLTQILSLSLNKRYQITLSPNSYQISDIENNVYIHPVNNNSTITLPSSITLSSTQSPILFNTLGTPYIDASTPMNSAATITLTSSNGNSRLITIRPQTGHVSD